MSFYLSFFFTIQFNVRTGPLNSRLSTLSRVRRVRAPLAERPSAARDRTMCPRAVRSTEWVRQTRNIIVSMAGG